MCGVMWQLRAVSSGLSAAGGSVDSTSTPSAAPEASAVLVKIIFLADIMVHYISQEIDYYQIDKDILAYFKFSSQKQFDEVIEKL